MIPLLIILAVVVLVALIPVGVRVTYDTGGLFLYLRAGPFRIELLPGSEKPAREKKGGEKKAKREKPAGEKPAKTAVKGGPLALVRAYLPLLTPTLARLKRRLTLDVLRLRVVWAAADPADAAVGYGMASAVMGTAWQVLRERFKVRDCTLSCDVDFTATAPTVYLQAQLSLRVGQAVTFALPLLIQIISIWLKLEKEPVKTGQNDPKIQKKEA